MVEIRAPTINDMPNVMQCKSYDQEKMHNSVNRQMEFMINNGLIDPQHPTDLNKLREAISEQNYAEYWNCRTQLTLGTILRLRNWLN